MGHRRPSIPVSQEQTKLGRRYTNSVLKVTSSDYQRSMASLYPNSLRVSSIIFNCACLLCLFSTQVSALSNALNVTSVNMELGASGSHL
jgi:hypothetical protein